jgi:hypothetical protein
MEHRTEDQHHTATTGAIDIFVSYAREDRQIAEMLVSAFESAAWSVWFDSRIAAGASWDKDIETALSSARCVVVLWSKASVQSDWVRAEAEAARMRKVAVPVRLDDVEVPVVFRMLQTPSLVGWTGERSHRGFAELYKGVSAVLGRPCQSADHAVATGRIARAWLIGSLIAFPTFAVLGLHLTRVPETLIALDATVSEFESMLSAEREVTDSLLVSELAVAGVREIEFPRVRTGRDEPRNGYTINAEKLLLRRGNHAQPTDSVTLGPVLAPAGARVLYRQTLPASRLRISLQGSTLPMRVNVRGIILVQLPREGPTDLDFGSPRAVVLTPDENGADLDLTLINPPSNLLPIPLPVSHISLSRIDERVTTGRSEVVEVSTIVSGEIRVGQVTERAVTLYPTRLLRLGEVSGEIKTIGLAGDGIHVRFEGTVRRIQNCLGNVCESMMPTWLGSLLVRQRLLLFFVAVVYIMTVLVVLMRVWRKVGWVLGRHA